MGSNRSSAWFLALVLVVTFDCFSADVECPPGSYYKEWPVFSDTTIEYYGNAIDTTYFPNYLRVDPTKAYNGETVKTRLLSFVGDSLVGTHIEVQYFNTYLGIGEQLINNARMMGLCLYNVDMSNTLYGIWFSYNIYGSGGRWVWVGEGSSFYGLSAVNLTSGPHGIKCSMDFIDRDSIDFNWRHRIAFTFTFTSGTYEGTSYYDTAWVNVGTKTASVGMFFDAGTCWKTWNNFQISYALAYGPTIDGIRCWDVHDLMPLFR